MNRTVHILTFAAVLVLAVSTSGHIESPLLPEGCGSCHVGHGLQQQPMLNKAEEDFCYQCHGSEQEQSLMKAAGKLSAAAQLADIKKEFTKPYRHPVVEGFGHSPTERLPSESGVPARHAECVDCHNPHQRHQGGARTVYEVPGYSLSGQYLEVSLHEYEICFKCHVDYTGVSEPGKDAYHDFSLANASQHPVVRGSVGKKSVSLLTPFAAGATMKCSDCHTNDDPNGPRGPHGSNYRFLLSGNYDTDIYADESPFAYQFCYSCHDRSSILNNESFPLHREHIVGDPLRGIRGTSCYTCHAAHSSRNNPYLIRFNRDAVSPSRKTGRLDFSVTGSGSGQCYLTCHGHSHEPGSYSR
jgi:predicted CXXCH cytochrome family protein